MDPYSNELHPALVNGRQVFSLGSGAYLILLQRKVNGWGISVEQKARGKQGMMLYETLNAKAREEQCMMVTERQATVLDESNA